MARKIKESSGQISITVKCYECEKGFHGNKTCFTGTKLNVKNPHLGCWDGKRIIKKNVRKAKIKAY